MRGTRDGIDPTMRYLLLALTFVLAGKASATGEINVLTDLDSPFPPGCVAVSLPEAPVSRENEIFNKIVTVPSVEADAANARVRIRIWRTGCHDQGFSVVMVRLTKLRGGPVLVPALFAEAGQVELPYHVAQLIRHPAVGDVGATGNVINQAGVTYMLAVDRFSLDGETLFTPADYNELFTLEFYWGDYAGTDPAIDRVLLDVFPYDPALDPPQNNYPILHGRMSGQYTVEGRPNTGLVFEIGEQYQPDPDTFDTNTASAILFTYIEGQPFWLVGALANLEPGFDQVTLEMFEVEGGRFISTPPGSYDEDDIDSYFVGTMTIEALDCNRLLVGYNFNEGGLGSGSFEAKRLVRIAGYDCNPWQYDAR